MFKSLFLAGALALATAASASNLPDYPFIHTNGSADMYWVPDIGEIDFEIVVYDADPAVAMAQMEARAEDVRMLLEAQGIPPEQYEIRKLRRELRKGSDASNPVYDFRFGVHVEVRVLDKWRAVVEPLLNMPSVDNFGVAFNTVERKRLEDELMAKAIQEATRKATAMAAGFGKKLGTVAAVSSSPLRNLTNSIGLAEPNRNFAAARNAKGKDFYEIQGIQIAQQVDVIFKFK